MEGTDLLLKYGRKSMKNTGRGGERKGKIQKATAKKKTERMEMEEGEYNHWY